jgi:hypothetical protein
MNYLLQLPNKARRIEIVKRLSGVDITECMDQIAKKSLFFGFSDLKAAVDEASLEPPVTAESIAKCFAQKDRTPSTSLESYIRRYKEENFPFDELIGLMQLAKEVNEPSDLREIGGRELSNAKGFTEFVKVVERERNNG